MRTRTKFVIAAIVAIMLYTVAVFVAAFFDKQIPDSLTVAYFSAWTVELALLAGIKIKKD